MHPQIGQLLHDLRAERSAVIHHPVLQQLEQSGQWNRFLEQQAFAVWDSGFLIRRIGDLLSPGHAAWMAKAGPESVFLMNQLCAGADKRLDAYLRLLENLGACTQPVLQLDFYYRQGTPLPEAMQKLQLAPAVQQFVLYTFYAISQLPLHALVAMLLLGREDLLTDALEPRLRRSASLSPATRENLIQTFAGPWRAMGQTPAQAAVRLLTDLCGEEPVRWMEATQAVRQSLLRRKQLLDALQGAMAAPALS